MADHFRRPYHNAILQALNSLNGELFARAECYFGGGTAIVLALDEYRESRDIDFLCSSQGGYRRLRRAVWGSGLGGLLSDDATITEVREMRTDQYGIRTVIGVGDLAIRFEVVREARINLTGEPVPLYGIPVLHRHSMYAEKLLANADRGDDASTMSRDIIDLSMMIARWGNIPTDSWAIARDAYGDTVDLAYARSVQRIRDPDWLRRCMDAMAMAPALADEILAPHGGPLPGTPSPLD